MNFEVAAVDHPPIRVEGLELVTGCDSVRMRAP